MNTPFLPRLTIAVLACGLAATAPAGADEGLAGDSLLTRVAPPALALASTAALAELPPPEPDGAAASPDARELLGATAPQGDERAAGGARAARPKRLPLLTDEILRELVELPLLDTVMAPVTRGVTFETVDGGPAVTFAVKPTKFTRGSGLVAIGRF